MKKAMVVGGQESFVKDKLARSLKRHGIGVHTHLSWTKRRPPSTLPKGIDLVYICTDMVGHGLAEPCVKYARDLGIPFVNGTRKWAESIERLTQAGFPLLDPACALPEIIDELVSSRPPGSKPTESDLRGVAIAIMGDVTKADSCVNAPVYNEKQGTIDVPAPPPIKPISTILNIALPELPTLPAPTTTAEPKKEPAMPLNNPTDSRLASLGLNNAKQQAYIKVLVANPRLMTKDLWDTLKDLPLFAGNKLDTQRAATAREQLGIKVTRADSKRYIDIDLEKFLETAEALGLQYVLPEAHYEDGDSTVFPPIHTAKPVEVEPAPVAAPNLGNASVVELLSALRVAMQKEQYTEIHLTPDGVGYKKVVVQEGKFDI